MSILWATFIVPPWDDLEMGYANFTITNAYKKTLGCIRLIDIFNF
jgi:hypothetical protein